MKLPNIKQDYRKKMAARLKKIRTRIGTLEKRAGKAEAGIRVRYDQKINQIRGQYALAKDKLEELGKARHDAWLDQKAGLERAIETLSEAVDKVAHQISV